MCFLLKALFHACLLASCRRQQSFGLLAFSSIYLLLVTWLSLLSPCVIVLSPHIRTPVILDLGPTLIQYDLILFNQLHRQRLYFLIRPHCEVLGRHEFGGEGHGSTQHIQEDEKSAGLRVPQAQVLIQALQWNSPEPSNIDQLFASVSSSVRWGQ